jgi:hypothetical protein
LGSQGFRIVRSPLSVRGPSKSLKALRLKRHFLLMMPLIIFRRLLVGDFYYRWMR